MFPSDLSSAAARLGEVLTGRENTAITCGTHIRGDLTQQLPYHGKTRDLSHKGRTINLIHLELNKAFDMEKHQLRQRTRALPEALFMHKHLI